MKRTRKTPPPVDNCPDCHTATRATAHGHNDTGYLIAGFKCHHGHAWWTTYLRGGADATSRPQ